MNVLNNIDAVSDEKLIAYALRFFAQNMDEFDLENLGVLEDAEGCDQDEGGEFDQASTAIEERLNGISSHFDRIDEKNGTVTGKELHELSKSIQKTGEAEYKKVLIFPAPEYGYMIKGDRDRYESILEAVQAINRRLVK